MSLDEPQGSTSLLPKGKSLSNRNVLSSAFLISTCAILLCGCAARHDVAPLYDAAILNFEAAHKLEAEAINAGVESRIAQIGTLFDELRQLATIQMKSLIVTRWGNEEHNFKIAERDDTWRAFFGLKPNSEIPAADLIWSAGALDRHLSVVFWTNATDSVTTAYDILIRPNNVAGFTGAAAPPAALLSQITETYETWHSELVDNVLGRMLVIKTLDNAEQTLLVSLNEEKKQRRQRIDAAYGNLIEITSSARAYAGALTDNAQIIGLANSILKAANAALGKAWPTATKTEKLNPGGP